jgi:glycosyltransferase involved in cell wall biosynthesis
MSILRKVLAKQAAMKAHKIIVDANCMKQIWTSMGVPQNKVEVIPFGVDTNLFNPDWNGNPIRKKLNIRKRDIAVISTRPFFKHYDVKCLIKAIPVVIKKHKNVKFIIKGRGPLERHIRTLAKKLHIAQYVRFTDPVQYHEMPYYFSAADIYVSTSYIDSTSVSLLEAMACELPPITTDIPGNREWIKNEVNGLLYPPKDYKTLAEKITQLIENQNLRKKFGYRCREIVKKRAAWDECVAKLESIYLSLLGK